MREDLLLQCRASIWALRNYEDLDTALLRYAQKQQAAAEGGESQLRVGPAGGQPVNGVQVIPIYGVIGQMTDLYDFPDTPVEWLAARIDQAVADPAVGTIIYDVNSPGGSVFGVPELAAKMMASRPYKKSIAVANASMGSAALWLGTAASEVVITPSGEAGSIGVWMAHTDASKLYDRIGIKVTLISSGKYKVDGNSFGPPSADFLAFQQQRVDGMGDRFTKAVATQRGVPVEQVRKQMGEGRMLGAKEAVASGMVDRIATLEEVISRASGRAPAAVRKGGRASAERSQALLEQEIELGTTSLSEN
jgi:signal peptide peptidase SppA